jgi:hypothetical protein
MTLSELLLFLFGCSGITFIVVHATIMDLLKIRPLLHKWSFFKKLTTCSLCTGAWAGMFLTPFKLGITQEYLLSVGAASAASFLFERATILLDCKIIEYEKKEKENQ